MSISADSFVERLYLKAQLRKWRLLAIMFAVITLLVGVRHIMPHSPLNENYIARITLDGIIDDNQKIYDLFDRVSRDDKAKALIVWLDTPGGSAVGGEEIYIRLREIAERKPVVAVMRSVSASAGYMAALGADYIVAREGTITGSIGVIIQTAEITELAQKLGIKPIEIKSAPLKAAPSPFEKNTPEAERVMKSMIMDFYDHFVDMVAQRRNLPREQVLKLADGRVYSGRKAVETKLIDAIGGEQDAVHWLEKNRNIADNLSIEDVKIDAQEDIFERIVKGVAGNFWQKSTVGLDGLRAIWHPQLY